MADTPVIAGKPVVFHEVAKPLNLHSGFKEKMLCDGLTFSLGTSCVYTCSFCYVPAMMTKLPAAMEACAKHGVDFTGVVLRRTNALEKLKAQLLDAKGRPKFKPAGMEDQRVVYASPLVDVAATIELCNETVAACRLILEHTNWHIRLLSKSNLLPYIAGKLGDFERARERVIYGVSTGTLDDRLAAAFEQGTALVSKRIKSLHYLQDRGWRTFGMICPSLPQEDYGAFARAMALAIRYHRCEHVWAEAINVRGESMHRTLDALEGAGFAADAARLKHVSEDKDAWEEYTRATFEAHAAIIPSDKLRFLQYVTPSTREWWKYRRHRGAVLLGRAAGANV